MVSFKDLGVKKAGDLVKCLYPVHGSMNILQLMQGPAEKWGVSKNGKYITIKCDKGYRSMNLNKIVKYNG